MPYLTHEQRRKEAAEKRGLFHRIDGFQIHRVRRPVKSVPAWANNIKALQQRMLGKALQRYEIAYLYWRVGWNAREIAVKLKVSRRVVTETIARLKRDAV
jgi:hypothetical protein